MPTLPTQSLFDKDLSLRSPLPHHVPAPTPQRRPVIAFAHPTALSSSIAVMAPHDFNQIRRPTPSKAKTHSVFDLSFESDEKSMPLKSVFRPPVPYQTQLRRAHIALPRISAAKDLDRMLLASPMPKVISFIWIAMLMA